GESMKAERGIETGAHMTNFLEAVRSRNYKDLTGEVAVGAMSADLVHIANISYRLKRRLEFDPATRKFRGDAQANAMLTRPKYRAPYIVA
ncbi:MAG: gfo/Idh/MocA family oxidoreductase, partial [Acidobacteria bacterium]|nr:gfo/Idh/MocA family oxidoreductase [Acidobacteriota bacterium]